jgi:hypothetical protein
MIVAASIEAFSEAWALYFPEQERPSRLVLDSQAYDDLDCEVGGEFADERELAAQFLHAPFYLRTIARDAFGLPCAAWVLIEAMPVEERIP